MRGLYSKIKLIQEQLALLKIRFYRIDTIDPVHTYNRATVLFRPIQYLTG